LAIKKKKLDPKTHSDSLFFLTTIKPQNMSEITVIRTVKELRSWKRQNGDASLGFVPTMGALHQGHLSLGKYHFFFNTID